MKIQCEVGKIESLGDAAKVTLTNVKRVGQAEWQEYGPEISLRVPLSKAKSFPVGRNVKVTVQAC